MADNKSTFIQRVISAVLGAGVVFSLCFFGGPKGVQVVCFLAVTLAIREYSRMFIAHAQMPAVIDWLYRAVSLSLYLGLFFLKPRTDHMHFLLFQFSLATIIYIVGTLWLVRGQVSNENLLTALTAGGFGMVYCVVFPYFALSLSTLDDGVLWFFFMLIVVFFGDTFAYFAGRWCGRNKLYAAVSPNKTWEGALGGLVGSSLGGVIFGSSIFQDVPWYKFLVFCVVCGAVAQSGDLLMSLVKRVAHVKDTGHLMPGHGGILDRLDGIFIACPLVYAFALYVRPF
jgi:phosphatidate cytidylyltransferase